MPPPPLAITSDALSQSQGRSFPTPFKCSGDFCGVVWQLDEVDSYQAKARRAAAASALGLLLSEEELSALGDTNVKRLVRAVEVAQLVGKGDRKVQLKDRTLQVTTYKSIALSRNIRQQLEKAQHKSSHLKTDSDVSNSLVKTVQPSSHVLDNTRAQELRETARLRVFGELDGVANYYRQVHVCVDCYAVYTQLNLARQMTVRPLATEELTRKQQQISQRHEVIEEKHVTKELREKESTLWPQHNDTSKHAHAIDTNAVEREGGSSSALPALANNRNGAKSTVGSSRRDHGKFLMKTSNKHTISMPSLSSALVKAAASTTQLSTVKAHEQTQLLGNNVTKPVLELALRSPQKTNTKGSTNVHSPDYPATLLLVSSDRTMLNDLHQMIRQLASSSRRLELECMTDGRQALRAAQDFDYDVVLVERDLGEKDMTGLEFSRLLRQSQLKRRISTAFTKATIILCVSSQTTANDLQLYKKSGMDGCIGKPLDCQSLHHTLEAALEARQNRSVRESPRSSPQQVAKGRKHAAVETFVNEKHDQHLPHRRRRRRSHLLAVSGFAELNARDDYVDDVFQMDAETAIPFCVMGGFWKNRLGQSRDCMDSSEAFFNLVIVHDLYDTWERLQILLQPLVARYRGHVQVLVWNYPGQAYTTWRRGTLLHNTFHATCLKALLGHVTGSLGNDRLLRDKPYHLVGVGNGGNIALSFCCSPQSRDVNTRSLVLLNSFAHVDAQVAQFLHDSANVLACTPESRPDLPVFFHARFLFSAAYLARVTTPLALNLYTAVHNPITLEGRQALTLGALAHHDLRTELAHVQVPLILMCSAQNKLFDAGAHAEIISTLANLELVDSVGKVLQHRRVHSLQQQSSAERSKHPSCVIWLPGGHEALQECKQNILVLLEQLVTGFHEFNDVPHDTSRKRQNLSPSKYHSRCEDEQPRQGALASHSKKRAEPQRTFEDVFIDRVLMTAKLNGSSVSTSLQSSPPKLLDGPQWRRYQHSAGQIAFESCGTTTKAQGAASTDSHSHSSEHSTPKLIALTAWDPTTPAFERISTNVVYQPGAGSKIYPLAPQVKEYMGWRVRRNQKRLLRMNAMARIIQRAFRAFCARTLVRRLHREQCTVHLQSLWRARVARKRYQGLKREDWAVRLLQRHWRGKMGRTSYKQRILEYLSALDIQRIARGWLTRCAVMRRRHEIYQAAVRIQQLMRRFVACRKVFRRRQQRNAAMDIQRMFRGLLGRRRFTHEREKFFFSITQTQGLTFGKQLLLEYKLYGTKLQSDVVLLTREKSDVEAQAEKLISEIGEFDDGIRLLEGEFLALGRAETDSNAPGGAYRTLDEAAKWALREQKMRLDREFSQMLAQIAQRREKLATLEETLARIDQERLRKEEELKTLERKLVLLLEDQQKELARIREKQEKQSQLASDSTGATRLSVEVTETGSNFDNCRAGGALATTSASEPQSGVHGAGFSRQQREEAASLMESTETMMKFGFMSMSMTYFSSMNMVRAMRKIGAHHLTLDSAAAISQQRWPENSAADAAPTAVTGSTTMSPAAAFQPSIPPGRFPGQQPRQVAAWSVSDVGQWLDTLALGQYKRAFADATVDGALLLHLTDDDLRNTLGMEHSLHRKKVLTMVEEMRMRERNQVRRLYGDGVSPGLGVSEAVSAPGNNSPVKVVPASIANPVSAVSNPSTSTSAGLPPATSEAPPAGGGQVEVSFAEFCSLVRHGKLKQIREALQDVPERKFDPLTIKTQFVPGTGTVYSDRLEKSVFHVNKGDNNGNSPLLLAAQNNQLKMAQLLLSKGAYADHQNSHGHTASHYAMAYSFFDLGAWLLDPDKGGSRDDILNENGLNAYDGLS